MLQPNDAEIIAAIHGAVAAARATANTTPLPPVTSIDFVDAVPAVRIAVLATAGAAFWLQDRERRRGLREAALDVHGGDTAFWRRMAAEHVPYTELHRRRAEPGPMAGGTAA